MAVPPADAWTGLVARPAPEVPLDTALFVIAAHGDPDVDVTAGLGRLDDLAARCRPPTLDGLLRLLFVEEGFDGERDDYYDPRNSYLHQVLDRRRGLPITLSVLTLEVGRRCGVPLAPVNLPGHFLLRDRVDRAVFVDPFHRGAVIDIAGVERLHAAVRPGAAFDASLLDEPDAHEILRRVLSNLYGVFLQRGDARSLQWVLELRSRLPGSPVSDMRELARVHAARGDYAQAVIVLESALADLGTASDGDDEVRDTLEGDIRRIAAKLN
jgi:regulator of sirC expression with transglutaminase-like and TPR domain